jgi:hypothetical protein
MGKLIGDDEKRAAVGEALDKLLEVFEKVVGALPGVMPGLPDSAADSVRQAREAVRAGDAERARQALAEANWRPRAPSAR